MLLRDLDETSSDDGSRNGDIAMDVKKYLP
jgi:hypothetical protein